MIMRGISFLLDNGYNQYLWKIFQFCDLLNYTWYISQDEILYFDFENQKVCSDFFTQKILTGREFKDQILKNQYYIYLANIQAYPLGEKKDNIITYNDFEKSKCEIIFLCCDGRYVDLYSKDKQYLEKVFDMCKKSNLTFVEYITDKNDKRREMRI